MSMGVLEVPRLGGWSWMLGFAASSTGNVSCLFFLLGKGKGGFEVFIGETISLADLNESLESDSSWLSLVSFGSFSLATSFPAKGTCACFCELGGNKAGSPSSSILDLRTGFGDCKTGGSFCCSMDEPLCSNSLTRDVVGGIGDSSGRSVDLVEGLDPALLLIDGAGDLVFGIRMLGGETDVAAAGDARTAA